MPNTNVMQAQGLITFVTKNHLPPDLTTFGGRLRSAMEELDITQGELAKRAGVAGQSTVGMWLSGERKMPRSILNLAAAAQVEPQWLQHNKGPRKKTGLAPGIGGASNNSIHEDAEDRTDEVEFDRATATGKDAELAAMEKYLAQVLRKLKPHERLDLVDYARFLSGEKKYKPDDDDPNVRSLPRKKKSDRGSKAA